MRLNSIALLCGLFLTGCQSTQVIDTSMPNVSSVSSIEQLDTQQISLPSQTEFIISNNTQTLDNENINSPAVKFNLPIKQGPLSITITSKIKDSVFSPNIIIVDEKNNIISKYTNHDFEYKKPRLNKGNRLISEFSYFPTSDIKSASLIIYTTDEELAKFTDTIHPARLDAEARGNYFPEAKDIPMPHKATGNLVIDIEPYSNNSLFSLGKSNTKEEAAAPDEAVAHYHNEIKKAVNNNDLPKALALLEEAKSLNIKDAESVFINALEKNKK